MYTIDLDIPLVLNEKPIKQVRITYPSMSGYLKILQAAQLVATEQVDSRATVQSERIRSQCAFIDAEEKTHHLDYVQLANLPIKLAKQIIAKLEDTPHDMAKLLSEAKADGISSPILVQLGKPLATGSGKPITELEFMAKTYGDVEQVMVGDNSMEQAFLLIKTVGKPPGMQALPTWAIDQVSWQDGAYIANNVLPRFLE